MIANHSTAMRMAVPSAFLGILYVSVAVAAWRASDFAGSPAHAPDAGSIARGAMDGRASSGACGPILSRYVAARYSAEVAKRYPAVQRFQRRADRWLESFAATGCPPTAMLVAGHEATVAADAVRGR